MSKPAKIDPDNIPSHIAIIMDGNGRWAQHHKLLRTMGHKVGVDSVLNIIKSCRLLGVKVLTLYAFSSENWQRPEQEVSTLMSLLKTFLARELTNLTQNNIKLRAIGQEERLPADVREVLHHSIRQSADNTGMVLNLALSYGSRDEIVRAVRLIAEKCLRHELSLDSIDMETINEHLYTCGLPDPDLIIRTGGESRLSNFLLWQASYSEIYITDTHWPDFREPQLLTAIADYQKRQRRFGKTGEQVATRTSEETS
ncbi:MAG: isoprenyl transferase [Desulfobulbaceae bacterium]|nr:isoprenyl transferase [Desulfobulbaceae bacterium]